MRILYLDGWRGLAIISVLIAHFGSDDIINLGRFGVELFFVLSGRLMAEILFVRKAALPSFFIRRISRVYPALFALCIVMLATASWRAGDPSMTQFISSITFTSNYAKYWTDRSPVLDHIWSLCVEEHMYLILGAIAFAGQKYRIALIPTLCLMTAAAIMIGVVQTVQGFGYNYVFWRTDTRGASILIGVIAYLTLNKSVPKWLSWSWMPVILAAAALVLNLNVVPNPIKYSIGTIFLATSLILIPQAPVFFLRFLEHPILLRTGTWSYSIYLWQQPFSKIGGPIAYRLAYLLMAVTAAVASFYLIEQPVRIFLNKRFGRDKHATATATATAPRSKMGAHRQVDDPIW